MMTLRKLMTLSGAVVMLGACAPAVETKVESVSQTEALAENSDQAFAKKQSRNAATVKPGANVSLNSVKPKDMAAGSFQTVKLQLTEGYSEGVLTVSIEPSDGLSLFGGSNSKTFNMVGTGPHEWDVDVKADTDGVYFLNVFAEAHGLPRSFSVRIDVGAVTQKMFDDAMPADGELSDGGKIRVLEAEETIQ